MKFLKNGVRLHKFCRFEVLWFWGICDFGVSALDWLFFEKDGKVDFGASASRFFH
jgi:hypothetical protein